MRPSCSVELYSEVVGVSVDSEASLKRVGEEPSLNVFGVDMELRISSVYPADLWTMAVNCLDREGQELGFQVDGCE